MNTQNNPTRRIFLALSLCALTIAGIFSVQSCDPESDAITENNHSDPDKKVYALSGSSTIIDMADVAGLSENDEVSISNEPKLGKLTKLAGTLYRYLADKNSEGIDEFSFTIAGRSAKQDPVVINISGDSTSLPCHKILAIEDIATTPVNTKVKIRFLDNDRLCGVRKKDINKSINRKPKHGKATIVDNVIVYKPDHNFEGSDELIYAISAHGKGKSYGLISITVGGSIDSCTVIANDDFFTITSDYSFLSVLRNDNTCGNDSISIIDGPHHGYAFPDMNNSELGIGYVQDSSATFFGDTLRYRVCSPTSSTCGDAMVVIMPDSIRIN
jgi:hypothetical protein